LGAPIAVASIGEDAAQELVVASRGSRRHALHILPVESGAGAGTSLRPEGHHDKVFEDLVHVHTKGDFLLASEQRANRVQIFKEREFHYAIEPVAPKGTELRCARMTGDGRFVCAFGGESSALVLLDRRGRLMRVLAESGEAEGEIYEPSDLVIEDGEVDSRTRIWVLDRDACRVQVFTLEGSCHGSFQEFPKLDS
jgi:hypothetical protein